MTIGTRAPRALIVEDESIIAMDLTQILRREGFATVTVVNSGERALEDLASGILPDLVVLDIKLRGSMGGVEIAAAIRARHGDAVPVIFMSGFADPATLRAAEACKPLAFLGKPFDVTVMAGHARRIVQGKGG